MKITEKDIEHLASLSDFSVSDAEKKSLKTDLENILTYVSELSKLDTENVEPTFQVFEMENVWRSDEILESASYPVEKEIKVPKVL